MTATEENLLGFLREFPEFGKCVKFLEEYIKGNRCLQRSQSDANLLDKSDSSEALSGVLGGPKALLTKTFLDGKDIDEVVKFAKKGVKDYATFSAFAKNLGVLTPKIEMAIRKMDVTKSRFDIFDFFEQSNKANKGKIMLSILLHWKFLRQNRGTAEELIIAMHAMTCTDFDSIAHLYKVIEKASLSKWESAANLIPDQYSRGTMRPGKKSSMTNFSK